MRYNWHRVGVMYALAVCLISGEASWAQRPAQPPTPVLPEAIVQNGPPADRPADEPGPAPGDGLFYVPGEYEPAANGVAWREGYWARSQSGWAWSPARWVKKSDGWHYIDGAWERDRGDGGQGAASQIIVNDGNGLLVNNGLAGGWPVVAPTVPLTYDWASTLGYGPGGIGLWGTGLGGAGISNIPVFYGAPAISYGLPWGGWGGWGGTWGWGGLGGWGWGW